MNRDSLLKEMNKRMLEKGNNPLILTGNRRTGKTWLAKSFAEKYYNTGEKNYVYFDCRENADLKIIFNQTRDSRLIAKQLEKLSGKNIREEETLVILDNIQEIPEACISLRYFAKKDKTAIKFHVLAVGNYLTQATQDKEVWKCTSQFILYPMKFEEFLENSDARFCSQLKSRAASKNNLRDRKMHDHAIKKFRQYLITGGLPGCVDVLCKALKDGSADSMKQALKKIDEMQSQLLGLYKTDFKKYCKNFHTSEIVTKTFDSIPDHFKKGSGDGEFRHVTVQGNSKKDHKDQEDKNDQKGRKDKAIRSAVSWLADNHFVYKIPRIDPSKNSSEEADDNQRGERRSPHNFYKLYPTNTGSLKTMLNIKSEDILNGQYEEFKAQMYECFVLQELDGTLYYNKIDRYSSVDLIKKNDFYLPVGFSSESKGKYRSISYALHKYLNRSDEESGFIFSEELYSVKIMEEKKKGQDSEEELEKNEEEEEEYKRIIHLPIYMFPFADYFI